MNQENQGDKMDLLVEIRKKLAAKEDKRKKREANGDYFNIYELCGIAEKENIHSNIIAHLLDPGWKHGQDNLFLEKFCQRLNITLDSGETSVSREEIILDNQRRPDIVIRNGSNLIVIENKTGTCDHEEQLQDYWKWMCDSNVTHRTLIYLTKAGEHPRCDFEIKDVYNKTSDSGDNVSTCTSYGNDNNKFILLPYSEIRDWCAHCSIIPGIPGCVADAFKQYANFIERWLNNEIDDADIIEFCTKHLDETHKIYLNNGNDGVTQWVKNNYDQIVKTYIASKFSGKGWKGNILEIHRINDVFRVSIQYVDSKLLMGITQTNDIPKLYMKYNEELTEKLTEKLKTLKYKKGARKNCKHDCWWILRKELNISNENIASIIASAEVLLAEECELHDNIKGIIVYSDENCQEQFK